MSKLMFCLFCTLRVAFFPIWFPFWVVYLYYGDRADEWIDKIMPADGSEREFIRFIKNSKWGRGPKFLAVINQIDKSFYCTKWHWFLAWDAFIDDNSDGAGDTRMVIAYNEYVRKLNEGKH